MAVPSFDPYRVGIDIFDIYNDAAVAPRSPAPSWPGGACNFVDLTLGAHGARCGCRRFWTRQLPGSPGPDHTGWCMCNHHACYHDEGNARGNDVPAWPNVAGQENERPRTGRAPLSPVVDVPLQPSSAVPGMHTMPSFSPDVSLSFLKNQPSLPTGYTVEPRLASSMPDTLDWAAHGPTQASAAVNNPQSPMPPIPSQCMLPSQTASTTSSAQAGYLRPFAGKGLQTLSRPAAQPSPLRSAAQEAARPLTPRPVHGSMDESFVFVSPDGNDGATQLAGEATQPEPRVAAARDPSSVTKENFRNLSDTVGGHEQRLDRLETVSFSAAQHEECGERYDQLDLRTSDLEARMEEVEKLANDHPTNSPGPNDNHENSSARSVLSESTNDTDRPTHSRDFHSQLETLQAQVTQLQSWLPTHAHPYEIEVVFLPFPLKKLWQAPHMFKSDVAAGSDDWTQLPMTLGSATPRSQSPFTGGEWAVGGHDAEWMLPRACGDQSMSDRRLRSRGLVKTVSIKGPDARSVQVAINSAFANVFQEMRMLDRPQCADPHLSQYLGLRSMWVPLRKIHKDSCLRFLSPAEMITPATWNVQFLNSVKMSSSEPRLFITHPDAYLQDEEAYETGWNWQRLRELTRVYPDITESQEVPEADAMEECWAWHETLDDNPSVRAPVDLHRSRHATSSSPSYQALPTVSMRRSLTPIVTRGQTPLLHGRRRSRPPHVRTTSVPLGSAAVRSSPAVGTRRIVSYEHGRRSSPIISGRRRADAGYAVSKRRTRSPSHPRFTPRWTMSPSPVPLGLNERHVARGVTPAAYATPHSNAPLQDMRHPRDTSVAGNGFDDYFFDDATGLDELYDIEIYESASDESFDEGDDDDDDQDDYDNGAASSEMVTHAQPNPDHLGSQLFAQLPEDEPWPGIEDRNALSDGENIDPRQADRRSDASSQPSEYPSTQRRWPDNETTGFHIHEDDADVSPQN